MASRFAYAIKQAFDLTVDKKKFTDAALANRWRSQNDYLRNESLNVRRYKKADNYKNLYDLSNSFQRKYQSLDYDIQIHNNEVARIKLAEGYALVGNVEGRRLDEQQMTAVVKDVHNHLIIAGAGTGKTTTVIGRIKFLINSGKCRPEDILVLSFTNASAAEMSERISKETGCEIHASTFHKLGLNIITETDGIKPKVSQINVKAFIRDKLNILMKDPQYMRALGTYVLRNRVKAKSEFEFSNMREYEEYLKLNPPVTIKNERVKSYGEMDIANYLTENGINYKYEAEYEFDTRTSEYGQYYPDFYLPDYGIYIEYFGVNRSLMAPDWFSEKNGLTGPEAYRASMMWKRNLHREKETVMIECYAYEKQEEVLLVNLEARLKGKNVKFSPRSPQEIWAQASQGNNSLLDGIVELFETAINLVKSNNYTIDSFKKIASGTKNAGRYLSFISVLEPVCKAYENQLAANNEIDFNDMVNLAAEYVRTGKYKNPFSYVIVDEYQDISKARYALLAALRMSRYYDLFCVGDDWQSIYRFSGSDVNYILDFEKYWGPTTFSRIETTYRFTQSLIDVSGSFIMRNPRQRKKSLKGALRRSSFSLGEISGYTENNAVDFMLEKIEDLPRDSTVFLIGRYSFDADILKENKQIELKFNNKSGYIDVIYEKRRDLKMSFLTAHKSKGLQADYVFIINNKKSRMGFPSMIQDDPILELLLENNDTFPFSEERRLYYVALTRAKEKVFILTVNGIESVFAKELEERYKSQLEREKYTCPVCGGRLIKKTGPYGSFFGCENYKITGCRYKKKIQTSKDNDRSAVRSVQRY